MAAAASCSCNSAAPLRSITRCGTSPPPSTSSSIQQSRREWLPPHIHSVSSPSNPFIKHCVKLRDCSKYRHSSSSAIVVGKTPIREILESQTVDEVTDILDYLLLVDGAEMPEEFRKSPVRVIHVSPLVMKKLAGVRSTDSVEAVAVFKIPKSFYSIDCNMEDDIWRIFPSLYRLLILDGIQDPGNLGTLLRTAVAFSWDGVFLLPGCCDPFNEKALRASRGACFQIPIVSSHWVHLESLNRKFGMKILAAHPVNYGDSNVVTLSGDLATSLKNESLGLVLGSEGRGLSLEAKKACELVCIPMPGRYESLNVSVAGGILLFILQRQEHL